MNNINKEDIKEHIEKIHIFAGFFDKNDFLECDRKIFQTNLNKKGIKKLREGLFSKPFLVSGLPGVPGWGTAYPRGIIDNNEEEE